MLPWAPALRASRADCAPPPRARLAGEVAAVADRGADRGGESAVVNDSALAAPWRQPRAARIGHYAFGRWFQVAWLEHFDDDDDAWRPDGTPEEIIADEVVEQQNLGIT